jgi:hypothetical protein
MKAEWIPILPGVTLEVLHGGFWKHGLQIMRLYLSRDNFPNTPDNSFHFTATPYSTWKTIYESRAIA